MVKLQPSQRGFHALDEMLARKADRVDAVSVAAAAVVQLGADDQVLQANGSVLASGPAACGTWGSS